MKTIFLAIPHYIFTSDLLRTKYIEYLSSKYRVIVLTPMIDGETAKSGNYFQSPNVIYIKHASERPSFWNKMKFFRLACVNEFDYLASMRHYYQRPIYKNDTKRRWLHFLAKPFFWLLTARFFSEVEQSLLPQSRTFAALVKEFQPALLVTATPGFDPWEAELILYARRFKLPSYDDSSALSVRGLPSYDDSSALSVRGLPSYDDSSALSVRGLPTVAANFSWDNLTMNCKHIRKTDYLIPWNEVMKEEAMTIHGYPKERLFVSGTPRFDPYFDKTVKPLSREEFLRSKGLNPKYKTIFHTTVTKAYPFQKKYIHDLLQLRDNGSIPYMNIFVRLHPLDEPKNYEEFKDIKDFAIENAGAAIQTERGARVEMSYADLLNLRYSLAYTDININYASTISIEACIFDKPVVNIGWIDHYKLAYDFNHYKPIVDSGAVKVAKTDYDLPKLINLYAADPTIDSENRKKIVERYVGFTDGLSYKRSVDFLDKIIQTNTNG